MRKIHPGFIALAVLLGPATIIRGHQVISNHWAQKAAQEPSALEVAQHVYRKCSEVPQVQRTVQCEKYVNWFDGCVASGNICDVRSASTRLNDFKLFPMLPGPPPPGKANLATATDS